MRILIRNKKNKYQLNSCEKNLLEELKRQLSDSKINKPIRYGFLSNGTMFVCLDGIGQIGRVKLRGRIFRMQIMKMSNSLSDYLDVKWLENITFDGDIGNSINFSTCTKLNHDSLMSIINHLKDFSGTSTTKTCTLGSSNLAKLTDAEKAIATQKGWSLA